MGYFPKTDPSFPSPLGRPKGIFSCTMPPRGSTGLRRILGEGREAVCVCVCVCVSVCVRARVRFNTEGDLQFGNWLWVENSWRSVAVIDLNCC